MSECIFSGSAGTDVRGRPRANLAAHRPRHQRWINERVNPRRAPAITSVIARSGGDGGDVPLLSASAETLVERFLVIQTVGIKSCR